MKIASFVLAFALASFALAQTPAQTPGNKRTRPLAVDDLFAVKRVSDPQVSPSGKHIAYVLRTTALDKNSSTSHLWLAPTTPGEPRQLTNHEKGESRPRWSPDGQWIAFLSSRSGTQQIWKIAVDGGEARQVTSLSSGVDAHVWSPTGTELAFTSEVWPHLDAGDGAQQKRQEELEASGIKAQVFDGLLYRHWNTWRDDKRSHVFVVSSQGGEARDVTPGDFDAPPFALAGPDSFAFSPNGKEIAYTRGPDQSIEAWSTNADLFVVPLAGGAPTCLTAGNKGADASPSWSPDGRFIAYRSQARDGYEADRVRLAVLERATLNLVYLAADVDRSVDEILWRPEGKAIYFLADDEGRSALFAVPVEGLTQASPSGRIFAGSNISTLSMPTNASFLACEAQTMTRPSEVARLQLSEALQGKPALEYLTHHNDMLLAELKLPSVESVRYPGALDAQIQAWLLKPPGWQQTVKYPLVVFIHGGPQSAWHDAFHFRWNAALYAAQGFIVLMPNPHGSTGFGQAFTEQISGDWGGACYEDIMKGVDWVVAQGLVDPDHMAAMGGSFGGYMANWILGHSDRFKALVSHAGVYNLEAMYGHTEEVWFTEWEFKGPPWKNRELYEKFSPHRFAQNFKTPTLVIHGELDFRVPVSEGMQLFTALQRQGVESRFLYYPDEGHWILKPKNSKLWNDTVLAWLNAHLKTPEAEKK